ncbi:hypothetical protein O181_039955 [Austropuccinia psidii MF-1]|uniref:Uncharacterized protein n=1 Tax=Austropuccinia psidii MF-1 TaxID=1389203 RepID=A0A9Q3DFU0_9BASI|nr:hypothetical protein [Austropuccinia psidii MF-1]
MFTSVSEQVIMYVASGSKFTPLLCFTTLLFCRFLRLRLSADEKHSGPQLRGKRVPLNRTVVLFKGFCSCQHFALATSSPLAQRLSLASFKAELSPKKLLRRSKAFVLYSLTAFGSNGPPTLAKTIPYTFLQQLPKKRSSRNCIPPMRLFPTSESSLKLTSDSY